jgi:crotonobetainyl-CoA:carnitine CoA-transferase CaiB-like acyl-CoA transferase
MPGALDGVRVVDFGQYIAGPLAAVMLSDQGADVIHVDPPGGPRWQSPADAFYNRGKQRITLDLKQPDGLDTARRLIERADVVIENFRPGVMTHLGLGAEAMTGRNPRLIYCSIPGFAAADPRADLRAWEGIIDAATDNCKPRTGEEPPGWDWTRPTYSAVPLASNFGAFLAATGVVMALIARHRTGRGQLVEVPLFDAMFTLIGHAGAYVNARGLREPAGIHGRGAGCFRCADGRYVQFDTSSARHLTWFARAAGLTGRWDPELLDLDRNRDPAVNERLHAHLRDLFLTRTAAEWEEIGNQAGAAIGFVRTVNEWIHTDHARQIGAVTHLDDPILGPTWMPGLPVRLSESPGAPQGPRQFSSTFHVPSSKGPDVRETWNVEPGTRNSPSEPDIRHPLQGYKVLDLCLALAGPTCGRLLLEFGADVIKINAPHAGVSGYLNRGKQSLLLDLDSLEGQRVFWKLAEQADIVLENFSPGAADRLGIGYTEAKARRPEIIYTSISCYGYGGPWTHGRGWERQGQAVTGIMERTGLPSVLGPYNLIDIGTGVLGAFATALAVYRRLLTGAGQHAQASLVQTGTYHQTPYMLDYAGQVADEPRGYEALGDGPLQRFYQARDGWFFLAATEPEKAVLAVALENRDLEHLEGAALEQALEAVFACGATDAWVQCLRRAGLSAHAVVPIAELMTDPIVRDRGLSVTQEVEGVGACTMPGLSVHLSDTPMRLGDPPRRPGSDAAAILRDLGIEDDLPALEKAWVLRASDLPSAWGGGG